jgi:archaellum component FlaC
MGQETVQNPVNILLSEFGARLNETEEKQRLIKDRMLLIGENLISLREDSDKNVLEFKKKISELEWEIKSIKKLMERVLNEIASFAKKNELEILERQFKMFNPLKEVTA